MALRTALIAAIHSVGRLADFFEELLEFAVRVQDATPEGTADAREWMRLAEDFANTCMPEGRLRPELHTGLPLIRHEEFTRHVGAIKAASQSYNSSLRPNIDNGIDFIIKTLRHEVASEAKPKFSIGALSNMRNALAQAPRQLLDEAWNYHVSSLKPFPMRSLPRIIGKQPVQDALKGLNGSLIYETNDEQGDRCYKLTTYGSYLTANGPVFAALLIRLLEYVKTLYEQDSFIKSISHVQIKHGLNVSDADTDLLLKLLRLGVPPGMPIRLGGWASDGSWSVSIGDEVIGLFRADDTVAYFDELLSSGYKPEEPVSHDARLRRELQGPGTDFTGPTPNPPTAPLLAPYVSEERLAELRKIRHPKFDCTRLICLCEELNECASRRNAHAVIMLTRAILDHVPPAFEFTTFTEVASNYRGGGKSFKHSIERLENQSRKVADRLLHMPIRDKEVVPDMREVGFAPELESMLSEFCRLLK